MLTEDQVQIVGGAEAAESADDQAELLHGQFHKEADIQLCLIESPVSIRQLLHNHRLCSVALRVS